MSRFMTKLEVELVDDTENDGRGCWRLKNPLLHPKKPAKNNALRTKQANALRKKLLALRRNNSGLG